MAKIAEALGVMGAIATGGVTVAATVMGDYRSALLAGANFLVIVLLGVKLRKARLGQSNQG